MMICTYYNFRVGKATKRERQKINKALREEEQARKAARKKVFRVVQALILVLIIPIVIVIATLINKATDPDIYTAKITVAIDGVESLPNNGVIEIELDNTYAPKSVKHFNGFASNAEYDGMEWHRAVTDFVIQSGDPNGDGTGALGNSIVAELPRNGYEPGSVAWAKGGNDPAGTAGSQFFIVTGNEDSEGLDALNTKAPQADGSEQYQYGYLGKVTKGIEVARMIEDLAPVAEGQDSGDGPPTKKAIIVKIEVFKNDKKINAGDIIAQTTTTTKPSVTLPANTETTESTVPEESTTSAP